MVVSIRPFDRHRLGADSSIATAKFAHEMWFSELVRRLSSALKRLIESRRSRRLWFAWLPAVNNGVLTFALLYRSATKSYGTEDLWIIPVAALAGTIASLGALIHHDIGIKHTLVALIAHTIFLILIFAGVYRWLGLEGYPPPLNRDTAIYFSVVTWTTLGYGDFAPSGEARLIAAFQAVLGYIFLGLIVGLTASIIGRHRD